MASKTELKKFIQGRYSSLLKEMGKIADNDKLSIEGRELEHKLIRERMKEVSNFASNFGVPLQRLMVEDK